MSNRQPELKVERPCPMTLGRMKRAGGFWCRSCNKNIIDFRGMGADEIVAKIGSKQVCGIFNSDQVKTIRLSRPRNILFKLLTAFAFIGFNVKPLSAQERRPANDEGKVHEQNFDSVKRFEEKKDRSDSTIAAPAKKKWWKRKKKKTYRTVGTPSF